MQTSGRLCLIVAVVVAAAGHPGMASITPVSQTRTVDADATAQLSTTPPQNLSDSDSDAALDFAPFLAEVDPEATAFFVPPLSLRSGQGVAKQDSTLGPITISAKGEASVSISLTPGQIPGGSAGASSSSVFDVTFSIDVPSLFWLSGTLDTQSIVTGGAGLPTLSNDVILWDLDGAVKLFDSLTADEAFVLSGTLNPGLYRLYAVASAEGTQASIASTSRSVVGISSFDLDLLVTNVPESETLLAFVGLGGLMAWRFRRRQVAR